MLSLQVVRSALRREKGREVVMFWYLESIEIPEKPHGLFGERPAPSLSLILACYSRSSPLGSSAEWAAGTNMRRGCTSSR